MNNFENFHNKSFVDQINILTHLEDDKNCKAISNLFELSKNPVNDTMVDHLVATTLQSLLSHNESEVLKRLQGTDIEEQRICIGTVAMNGFTSAVPLLHKLLADEKNDSLFSDILNSLANIKAPESLEVFRLFINYYDIFTSTTCIEMLGKYKDEESIESLEAIINNAEKDDQYLICSLQAGMAVESLAAIRSDKAIAFLVSKIHHRNATLRRRIQDELIKIGPDTVQFIASVFLENDNDKKILAANIIGFIGNKKGGEILISAMDSGKANNSNVKYAIYEAFGKIHFFKGLTCLIDALGSEEEELILLAVVNALNEQAIPGVITAIAEKAGSESNQSKRIIRALVAAKATNIFKGLYENEKIASAILSAIIESKEAEIQDAFKSALSSVDGERAKRDFEAIEKLNLAKAGKSLLAVDDSKPMLSFYRVIAADIGFKITTAVNGKEALDFIESGEEFDLIITDMNMPEMDGVELTRRLRDCVGHDETPVIMVTTESEQSQRDIAEKAGVNMFVTKPFTLEIIKEKIGRISGLL